MPISPPESSLVGIGLVSRDADNSGSSPSWCPPGGNRRDTMQSGPKDGRGALRNAVAKFAAGQVNRLQVALNSRSCFTQSNLL